MRIKKPLRNKSGMVLPDRSTSILLRDFIDKLPNLGTIENIVTKLGI